jgi:hypothetical protein
MNIRLPRLALCVLCAGAFVLSSAASADLYKWVDANGVTNYGNRPPATGQRVATVSESRVSTVTGMTREELAAQREQLNQYRLQRLEREIDDLRRRSYAQPVWDPVGYAPFTGYTYAGGGYFGFPGGRFGRVNPIPFGPQALAWPANPYGAVVPSPPVGAGPRVAGGRGPAGGGMRGGGAHR